MKRDKIKLITEVLSLSFILSYFLNHNIYLVLFGITISYYLININSINNFVVTINQKLEGINRIRNRNKKNNNISSEDDSNPIQLDHEDSKLKLVEEIEKYGMIPSLESRGDGGAA